MRSARPRKQLCDDAEAIVAVPTPIQLLPEIHTMATADVIQIFGTKKSADTRKAQRFFQERRVKVHFCDLAERPASIGELKRFTQKFGVDAVIDRASKRFLDLGLRQALYGEERWLSILADEPLILKQPLVRMQNKLSVGVNEKLWTEWLASRGA